MHSRFIFYVLNSHNIIADGIEYCFASLLTCQIQMSPLKIIETNFQLEVKDFPSSISLVIFAAHRWSDTTNTSTEFGGESTSIKSARASLSRLLGNKTSHTNGRHNNSGSALENLHNQQMSRMGDLEGNRKNFDG